jgi:L,D-peptidoglycan transpeptidase YkuD (ErfK/YbiS/YcfS/YnhG family)
MAPDGFSGQGVQMRRALLALLMALPLLLVASPADAAVPPGLAHVGSTSKVLVVTTGHWASTTGTATSWQKVSGRWRAVRTTMPVYVGRSGFSTSRHEGDGTSPAGTFLMRFAFGARANPGVHLGWRSIVPSSCWAGERPDYNRWVHRSCTSRDEDLWASRAVAYRYAAAIGFNDAPAVWGKGSAMFLHEQIGKATSGCVSMREADLLAVLRWMTPGTKIVMGPKSYVATQ